MNVQTLHSITAWKEVTVLTLQGVMNVIALRDTVGMEEKVESVVLLFLIDHQ